MISKPACACLAALACVSAFAQTPPKFEIADVHPTPKTLANNFMQANPPHNGRYEFHSASMIDLIHLAYGYEDDKILGGPSWLEMDRFEVIAQIPAGTNTAVLPGAAQGTLPDAVRTMLQSLLADRFQLVLREETKPLPGYALTVGKLTLDKKPQLKPADGTGNTGCKYMPAADSTATSLRFVCRNVSMDAFAAFLPRLSGGPSVAVVDKTGLKGLWNFDVSLPATSFPIGFASEIDKQLGLKLEPQPIPTQVVVVESANRTPTPNVAGVSAALPIASDPTAFDVATLKPTDPDYKGSTISLGPQPGGLWSSRGVLLSGLLLRAFSPSFAQRNDDLIVGMPDWARTTRFDLTARSPADASASSRAGPMVLSLLEDRLKLKWHTETRPISVFVLTPTKLKMKKADPSSRTHCLGVAPPSGSAPGSTSLTCQNITMEQFAEVLRPRVPGPGSPVVDSTGLDGGWDFTLTWINARGGAPQSADPTGGMMLDEALDKQLGLKLQTQKRPVTVTVIDHLEQTPTDN